MSTRSPGRPGHASRHESSGAPASQARSQKGTPQARPPARPQPGLVIQPEPRDERRSRPADPDQLLPLLIRIYGAASTAWKPLDRIIADHVGADHAATDTLSAKERVLAISAVYSLVREHGLLAGALGRLLRPGDCDPEPGKRLDFLPPADRTRLMVAAWALTRDMGSAPALAHTCGLRPELARALERLPSAIAEAVALVEAVSQTGRVERFPVIAEALSLPCWMLDRFVQDRGWPEALQLGAAMREAPPTTLRIVPHRGKRNPILDELDQIYGVDTWLTQYSPFGFHMNRKVALSALRPYREGLIDAQDEGSQLAALALGVSADDRILDLCAGAGGKTLLLASLQRLQVATGQLIAAEINPHRLKELRRRLQKQELPHVEVRNADALNEKALTDLNLRMDRVLVDAPCSGLGALRRNPEARWRLTPDDLLRFPPLQTSLLRRAVGLTRSGGRILYVTCTLNSDENMGVIQTLLQEGKVELTPLEDSPQLKSLRLPLEPGQAMLELTPYQQHTDGFFLCALRKR